MKTKFCFIVLFALAIQLHAQTLSPVELNTAGSVQKANGYSLSYSVGGTAVTTLSATNNMLTQGFQQPDNIIIVHVEPLDKLMVTVNAYPNPAKDFINVSLRNLEQPVVCRAEILSTSGASSPLSGDVYEFDGKNSAQIDLSNVLPGLYRITLVSKSENKPVASFMMIKIK
jgi:hypothetical protein